MTSRMARIPSLVPSQRRIGSSYTHLFYVGGTYMDIDRDYQLELLRFLRDSYPQPAGISFLNEMSSEEKEKYATNMMYLEQHGLVKSGVAFGIDGHASFFNPTLTHKGIDFIRDDGGLSAILGVVTVRLHSDTIKDLIEAKIAQSDLAPADKQRWIAQLRSLPADATKHLVQKLVEKGLDGGPAAIAAIGAYLKSQGLW